ncbi:kinesin-associated protein 3 isoform X1 [Contarinia nasturtii]|uniref:kinesin-associated protein 3 isoform X1 n=2 Tax=Contarinia nasturtii TaxID=265458 RepID=UPI0012D4A434|nr:kinesin-associated protein 3 isoform X1 [Contarinia nasturtii]
MFAELFNFVAGITLFLFVIHYLCYIVQTLSINPSTAESTNSSDCIATDKQRENFASKSTRSIAMQSEDAKYIKKRLKGGSIEPHPSENAIIINYTLEATVFNEPGDAMLEKSKNCQRILRLPTLNSRCDPTALAKEIVEKCDIIHKSQLAEVQQIIYYLKKRSESDGFDVMNKSAGSLKQSRLKSAYGSANSIKDASPAEPEKASIRKIDEYVDLLYEDLSDRIRGSALILQLARVPDNLEELQKNEAVLSALSRVLREDWRKSLDLSTNIVFTFFCFSTYSQFHNVITQYKIGSLCMDVIDCELKRYDTMQSDLENFKKSFDNLNAAAKDQSKSFDDLDLVNEEKPKEMEPPRRRIPELKQRPKSGNWSNQSISMTSSLLRSHTLNNSYHDRLSTSMLSPTSDNGDIQNDPKRNKDEFDRRNKQLRVFAKKQEQLIRVAFYLLLNIAENTAFEEKMCRKSIIRMLVKTLDRQSVELLMLVVTFLKKLSIIRDNKDEMNRMDIVTKFPRILQSTDTELLHVTLRLIFNLSFDASLRSQMIRIGLLPKMVTFLSDEKHHEISAKILYHFSVDDKVKSMFTYTEAVPLAIDMLLLNLNPKVDMDLSALCINLALNKRNATLMVENNRLHTIMSRAFKYQDSLLMKLVRNISQHESLRSHFVDFVGDLAQMLTICEEQKFTIECLGILGNLSLPDLDYSAIIQNFDLIQWIKKVLTPGNKTDDLVLDTVVFLGTCACDEACAMLLCRSDIALALIELLKAKQEDDEMVLQIIFVFQQILRNESTRDYMIKETQAPAYLIDLMHDTNPEIRKVCDYCLDVIAATNSEWATRIKLEKFRNYNSQWLEMVQQHQEESDMDTFYDPMDADDDNDLPAYLPADFIYQAQQRAQSDDATSTNSSANFINSRPVSRYSRDFDDYDPMDSSTKSRDEIDKPELITSKNIRADSGDVEVLTELE